jgi:hypothetical protein
MPSDYATDEPETNIEADTQLNFMRQVKKNASATTRDNI